MSATYGPSTTTLPFIWVVLLCGAIGIAAAGHGQAANQSAQPVPSWSILSDPVRQTSETREGDPPAVPADGAVKQILQMTQEWNWGALVIGRTYRGEITLSNTCMTDQRVGMSVLSDWGRTGNPWGRTEVVTARSRFGLATA